MSARFKWLIFGPGYPNIATFFEKIEEHAQACPSDSQKRAWRTNSARWDKNPDNGDFRDFTKNFAMNFKNAVHSVFESIKINPKNIKSLKLENKPTGRNFVSYGNFMIYQSKCARNRGHLVKFFGTMCQIIPKNFKLPHVLQTKFWATKVSCILNSKRWNFSFKSLKGF